jgi:hypothetical protein
MTGDAIMLITKNNDVRFIIPPAVSFDCGLDYVRHLPNNKDD